MIYFIIKIVYKSSILYISQLFKKRIINLYAIIRVLLVYTNCLNENIINGRLRKLSLNTSITTISINELKHLKIENITFYDRFLYHKSDNKIFQ